VSNTLGRLLVVVDGDDVRIADVVELVDAGLAVELLESLEFLDGTLEVPKTVRPTMGGLEARGSRTS
jgi:hypothetical protein